MEVLRQHLGVSPFRLTNRTIEVWNKCDRLLRLGEEGEDQQEMMMMMMMMI